MTLKEMFTLVVVLFNVFFCQLAIAEISETIEIYALNLDPTKKGIGDKIGTITFTDSKQGLVIKPNLQHLTPGQHGFHIHENPQCEALQEKGVWVAGAAAGSHFDPSHTGHHLGPAGKGHLGDLPALEVDKEGHSIKDIVAPHLTLKDIHRRSIVIHEHGDNYSDNPKPLGGGGPRVACGVIP